MHRTAAIVEPLYERLLRIIAEKEIVLADETTQRVRRRGNEDGRERAASRTFAGASSTRSRPPEAAKTAMDFILDVYRIERAALDADLLGTPEHLEMRAGR